MTFTLSPFQDDAFLKSWNKKKLNAFCWFALQHFNFPRAWRILFEVQCTKKCNKMYYLFQVSVDKEHFKISFDNLTMYSL